MYSSMVIHATSSEPVSQASSTKSLRSAISFQPNTIPDKVIDIATSRKLLRPTTPSNDSNDSKLTPRKRALARKASSSITTGLVSPPNSRQSAEDLAKSPQMTTIDDNIDIDEDEDPEAKTVLFEYDRAKILQFEDNNASEDTKSQGRLLGSGKFEIYQLHQKRVSYLQCGKSVVYPILPRLKILKISKSQFLLSLSNPERYWRIVLETDDESKINKLESTLKGICHFRNLYIPPSTVPSRKPSFKVIKKKQSVSNSNFDTVSLNSVSSISTAVACFALEQSDASTFVDDQKERLNYDDSPKLADADTAIFKDSEAESIDLAIDEFFETINNDTHYYTPSSTILHEVISRSNSTASIPLSPSERRPMQYSKSRSNKAYLHTDTSHLLSESTSWMDPSDEEPPDITNSSYISTSTPNTSVIRKHQRYISLNLNPPSTQKSIKRVITDPKLFDLQKQRQKEAVALYNILKNDDDDDNEKADSSFSGFLKYLF